MDTVRILYLGADSGHNNSKGLFVGRFRALNSCGVRLYVICANYLSKKARHCAEPFNFGVEFGAAINQASMKSRLM
jgi:hypothetical protein